MKCNLKLPSNSLGNDMGGRCDGKKWAGQVSYGSWGHPMEHGAVCWLEPLMNVVSLVCGRGEAS